MSRRTGAVVALCVLCGYGCADRVGLGTMATSTLAKLSDVDSVGWARLAQRRIFFGHQSVGQNIMEGIAEVLAANPQIRLTVVESKDSGTMRAAGFYHAKVGHNGFPEEKEAEFATIVDRGFAAAPGIAIVKFCYLDVHAGSDARALFESYQQRMVDLAARHAGLVLVHVTMPLTRSEPAPWYWVKKLLRRATTRDLNAIRGRYNGLLRSAYEGRAPVFDLAKLESTRPDGSRAYFVRGADTVYTLAAEYTTDGGHLNESARRMVAEQLVIFLARLPGS